MALEALQAAVPDQTIAQGFPRSLAPPTVKPSSFLTPPLLLNNNAPTITTFAPGLKLPTVHQWNLSFQRELPGGFVVQAAYIGRRGLRLLAAYDINQINADPILPSFLIMQQNVAKGCTAAGTGCPTIKAAELFLTPDWFGLVWIGLDWFGSRRGLIADDS